MLVEGDAAKKLQTSFVEDLRPFLLPVHSQAFVLLRSCFVRSYLLEKTRFFVPSRIRFMALHPFVRVRLQIMGLGKSPNATHHHRAMWMLLFKV